MRKVTVVGQRWAKVGARFANTQPCEVAPTCPIAKACQNLPWEKEFQVVSVRPVVHRVCIVHEGGAQAVDVEQLPYEASLDVSKTRGTAAHWSPPVCRFRGCPNWDRCFPMGPKAGREYILARVGERLVCPMGYNLVPVTLQEKEGP